MLLTGGDSRGKSSGRDGGMNVNSLPIGITLHSVSVPNPIEKKTLTHRIRTSSPLTSSSVMIASIVYVVLIVEYFQSSQMSFKNLNTGVSMKNDEWKYIFGTPTPSPKTVRK